MSSHRRYPGRTYGSSHKACTMSDSGFTIFSSPELRVARRVRCIRKPIPRMTHITDDIRALILDVYRDLHAHPELSHQEVRTSGVIREILNANGVTNLRQVAGNGWLVTIDGEHDGPTVAIRGDMDALPIQENRPEFTHASTNNGVMHACGHDAHTAMVIGATIALDRIKDQLSGRVISIFQPAEETEPLGARDVVAAGGIDGVERIFGMHVDPELATGVIGVKEGGLLAGGIEFVITVNGRAAHAARPHQSVDSIVIAATLVLELQKIPSRRIDPLEPVVITIGKFHGGSAKNVIAQEVVVEGTIRTLSPATRTAIPQMIERLCYHLGETYGAKITFSPVSGEPVLMNDSKTVDYIRRATRNTLGAASLLEMNRGTMGSDDFAFYTEVVPGAMFRLGVRNEEQGLINPLHHPAFGVDESALASGATVLVEAARLALERQT